MGTLGYPSENDYYDTSIIRLENRLLRNLAQFARHSTHCLASLREGESCDCGFAEAWDKWISR